MKLTLPPFPRPDMFVSCFRGARTRSVFERRDGGGDKGESVLDEWRDRDGSSRSTYIALAPGGQQDAPTHVPQTLFC